MAATPIQLQEPESFASGDTLWFERYLADYLPGNGWSLKYTLTNLNGQEVAAVQSVVSDTDANRHKIYQQNFAAGLDADDYIFTGEALNAGTGDRKQIYKAVLTLGADLQDGLATGPQLSENEQALRDCYATRRVLIKRQFTETEDLRTRFVLQKMSEVNDLIKELEEKVIWEKRAARAANGQPDGSTTSPVLRIFC